MLRGACHSFAGVGLLIDEADKDIPIDAAPSKHRNFLFILLSYLVLYFLFKLRSLLKSFFHRRYDWSN